MLPKLERRGVAIACAKFDMINVRQAGLRRHNQAFMVQVVHTVADAHGCTATIKWTPHPLHSYRQQPKDGQPGGDGGAALWQQGHLGAPPGADNGR